MLNLLYALNLDVDPCIGQGEGVTHPCLQLSAPLTIFVNVCNGRPLTRAVDFNEYIKNNNGIIVRNLYAYIYICIYLCYMCCSL